MKKWKMGQRISAAVLAAVLCITNVPVISVMAEDATTDTTADTTAEATVSPVVSLDFETVSKTATNLNTGIENYQFTDDTNAVNAQIMTDGGFTLTERTAETKNQYLDLSGNKYLTVAKADGSSPFEALTNWGVADTAQSVTILYDSYYPGNGNTGIWPFYTDSNAGERNNESSDPINLHYLGVMEEAGRVEKFAAGRTGVTTDSQVADGDSLPAGVWKRVAVVVDGTKLSLYCNGTLVIDNTNENTASLHSILGEESIFYIGAANWNGTPGEFYNGYIDNFQIYDGALTADEIKGTAAIDNTSIVNFDFESYDSETKTFTSGDYVATATIPENSGDVVKTVTTAGTKALDLTGSKKNLFVTKEDSTPLMKGLDNATIVFDSYLASNMSINDWVFSIQNNSNLIIENARRYVGLAENVKTGMVQAIKTCPGFTDSYTGTEDAANVARWKSVAVVFTEGNVHIYVDGQLKTSGQAENAPDLTDILGDGGGVFQIGRANWNVDGEYYNGMIDNFQVYGGALSAMDVEMLYEYNRVPSTAKIADFTFDDATTGYVGAGAVARPYLLHDVNGDNDVELYLNDINKTWLNVVGADGSPIKDAEELTISYYSMHNTNSVEPGANWAVFASDDATDATGHYIGVDDDKSSVKACVSESYDISAYPEWTNTIKDTLKRVDVVLKKATDTTYDVVLYIDSEKKAETLGMTLDSISSILGPVGDNTGETTDETIDAQADEVIEKTPVLQVGRGTFVGQEYYEGYIDDVKIYTSAVEPTIKVLNEEDTMEVLAGHLREELQVGLFDLEGQFVRYLKPTEYDVTNYKSVVNTLADDDDYQTITITFGNASTTAKIEVYNIVNSKQGQVLDENGNPMFTVSTTWYDFLSDPEREGNGSFDVQNYTVQDTNNDGTYDTSASEYVQFNNAISNYWKNKNLTETEYAPLYWGSFFDVPDAYENTLWGFVWDTAHAVDPSLRGLLDRTLTAEKNGGTAAEPKMGGIVTPYFGHDTTRLAADAQGDVYMNEYNNVQMPLVKTTDEVGIDYYEFYCGQGRSAEETGTFRIMDDEENTVIWSDKNECIDNKGTPSFLPFDVPNDGEVNTQNNGFGMRMEIPFYSTYDGCLEDDNGNRVPMVFEFNGDDDFFLFIDGYLVLDIGGVHAAKAGNINFATGEVTLDWSAPALNTSQVSRPYVAKIADLAPELDFTDPSVRHEIVVYYMERGKHLSSLRLKFNLPQENSIAITKDVDTSDVNAFLTTSDSENTAVAAASKVFDDVIADETFEVEVKSDYETAVQGPITSNNWAMYTIIIEDGGADGKNYLTSYINGVKIGRVETTVSIEDICADSSAEKPVKAYIGHSPYHTNGDPLFKGSIRDLNIYEAVLTQEDVINLYRGNSISAKPILAYDFSTIDTAENNTVVANGGTLGTDNSYAATIKGNGATVSGSILTLPGGYYGDGDAYVELPDNIPNGKSVLTINCLLRNEMTSGNYMALFIGQDTNKYWFLNPKNPNGHMKTVVSTGSWGAEQGIVDDHGPLENVDDENLLYHNGTAYAPGTISNGKLSIRDGEAMVLRQRDSNTTDEVGFLTVTGTSFSVKEVNVDAEKYDTSWTLTDTAGNLLGSSNEDDITVANEYKVAIDPYTIDDNNSEYECNRVVAGADIDPTGRFALLNENGTITPDSHSAMVRVNLTAQYVNKVNVGDITITKQLAGTTEDTTTDFKFTLTLSDLFGSESEDVLYQGTYYVGDVEKTATDGVITIKAGEKAVIKDIPVKTKYAVTELVTEGYWHLGNTVVNGVVKENTEDAANDVTMMNIKRDGNEFYVWNGHKTELPIENFYMLSNYTTGEPTTTFGTDNYSAVVEDGKLYITGNVHGNVLVPYYVVGNTEKINLALVHVYEPDNKAYVLDYGLPVELNAEPDSFGIDYNTETGLHSVTGQYLAITGVDGFVQLKGFAAGTVPTGPVANMTWTGFGDSVTNENASLTWKKASESETAKRSLVYEPKAFMNAPENYKYRVDITKTAATDMDAVDGNGNPMTAANGARMQGELTIVPASVVYYEDNFDAITISGPASVVGKADDLWQSNDQNEIYGYDEAYAAEISEELEKMDEDLVLHYDFSNISTAAAGTLIPDVSGHNNGGYVTGDGATVNGDTLTLPGGDKNGGAYVTLPAGLTNDKSAITVSAWLSADDAVFARAALSIGNSTNEYWLLNPRTDVGVMRSVLKINGASELNAASAENTVTTSDMALYTTVIEAGKITLYCNGEFVGSATSDTIVLSELGTDLNAYIGYSPYVANSDKLFDGNVRDVRVYDRGLDATEVKTLYTATATAETASKEGKLILHYDFKDMELTKDADGNVTAAVINDVSGNTEGDAGDAKLITGTDPALVPIFANGALRLSGGGNNAGSYLELPSGLTNNKTSMTISTWASSKDSVWGRVALYIGEGTNSYWLLNPRTNGNGVRSVLKINGGSEITASSADANYYVENEAWKLYTTVIESAVVNSETGAVEKTGKITLYCDGQYVTSQTSDSIILSNLGSDLKAYIGYSPYVANNGDSIYNGSLRDLRIYDYALTESEVAELYEQKFDSAGSSTRLDVDPANAATRGTMTFTFKGTGFDIVGRSTVETAGMTVKVTGTIETDGKKFVKGAVVDTVFYNGELYQLPIVSMKDLPYDTYTVEIKAYQTSHYLRDAKNTVIYIDGIRIYNPLGADETSRDSYYLGKENEASVYEVRELILGDVKYVSPDEAQNNQTSADNDGSTMTQSSKISLVTYDQGTGISVHSDGKSHTEDMTGVVVKETTSFKDILEKGPNNEVYLCYGNAIAFCVDPVAAANGRTVQIEAKKAAGENYPAALHVLSYGSDPQVIKVNTYSSMYYEIDLSKCMELPGGGRLVILASTGASMVSLTKIKVNGYELSAYNPSETYDTLSLRTISSLMLTAYETPVEEEEGLPFTDIAALDWFATSVSYVYKNKIMTGLNETTFAPYNTLTRAEFALILYRMEGQPEVTAESPFKDISGEEWFGEAVLWAQENGIVTGYLDGSFGPYDYITREQMAVIMYRYAEYKGYDTAGLAEIDQYKDVQSVSSFAADAVKWAVGTEMITGKEQQTLLDPQGITTRAECAVIVHRFLMSLED